MTQGQMVRITRGRRKGEVMELTAILSGGQVIVGGMWLYSIRSVKAV